MKTPVLRVPVSLLLDSGLTPSAKLIWMVARLHGPGPVSPALLEARCGLSRPTVRKGIVLLERAGWSPDASPKRAGAIRRASEDAKLAVPADLLADRRVGIAGRVFYGLLQAAPGFRNPSGRFTYAWLGDLAHANPHTVKQAVRELVRAGWLETRQANRCAPIHFSLRHPGVDRGEAEVAEARRRLEEAPFLGEALMREYLTLLVDSDDFEDNASPGFLVNPWTDERMELDRFYPPSAAFEFNGPQHYGVTDRFPGKDVARQRGRDYLKLGICVSKGIRLQVIHAGDLTLETMREKAGSLLPLRDLAGHERLIAFLESAGRRYRLAARRGRLQPGARQRISMASPKL